MLDYLKIMLAMALLVGTITLIVNFVSELDRVKDNLEKAITTSIPIMINGDH